MDGKEIGAYDLSEYRKHLAIVPQDVLLFGGSIAETSVTAGQTLRRRSRQLRKLLPSDSLRSFPMASIRS